MAAREALVEAAKVLLWERGFAGMSPGAVLAKSGVGQGSLYHHFPGKLALAEAALRETADEFCARLDEPFDPAKPPLERVRDWLGAPRQALKGCRMGRMAAELAIREEPIRKPVADYFAALERRLVTALKEAISAGELPAGLDARDIAAALSALVQGGYVLARTRRDASQMHRATAGALALLDVAARSAKEAPVPRHQ